MPRTAPPESPARRRPGRPAVAPDTRRSSTIGVSVSATEAAQLKAVAARVGLKPGTYLRVATLGVVPRVVPEGNPAHWRELGRLTGALTQLFDARKQGLPVTLDDALVDALRAEVRALRQALLGQEDRAGWTDPLPDAPRRLPHFMVDSDADTDRERALDALDGDPDTDREADLEAGPDGPDRNLDGEGHAVDCAPTRDARPPAFRPHVDPDGGAIRDGGVPESASGLPPIVPDAAVRAGAHRVHGVPRMARP